MNESMSLKLTEFKNWLIANNRSPNTVKQYVMYIRKFLESINDLSEINTTMITEYCAKQRITGGGEKYNTLLKALNRFIEANRLEKITLPKQKTVKMIEKIKQPITEKELGALILPQIQYIFSNPLKIKATICFMFYSGLRKQEIIDLKRKDFTFDEDILKIHIPKQQIIRKVPVPVNLKILLNKYFNTEAEETNAFNTSIDKLKDITEKLEQSEVLGKNREVYAHLFRDSFACYLLEKGFSLPEVQILMGHKDIKSTMKYVTMCPEKIHQKFLEVVKGLKEMNE